MSAVWKRHTADVGVVESKNTNRNTTRPSISHAVLTVIYRNVHNIPSIRSRPYRHEICTLRHILLTFYFFFLASKYWFYKYVPFCFLFSYIKTTRLPLNRLCSTVRQKVTNYIWLKSIRSFWEISILTSSIPLPLNVRTNWNQWKSRTLGDYLNNGPIGTNIFSSTSIEISKSNSVKNILLKVL